MTIVNPGGVSPFLLIGDHAGNLIPRALGDLGLATADRTRHVAWDIGIRGLGERLAAALDAVFLCQTYSRLVVDCNRSPEAPDAIAAVSDGSIVPGNRDLSAAARAARFAELHEPYHRAIDAEIVRRAGRGQATILIALHSFTPALADGVARPWHVGILHDRGQTGFAHALLATLAGEGDLVVGDNEPYRMDAIDYTVPRHAYPAGLAYAEIEVRQDLIGDSDGERAWSVRLARCLARSQPGE